MIVQHRPDVTPQTFPFHNFIQPVQNRPAWKTQSDEKGSGKKKTTVFMEQVSFESVSCREM